MHRVQVALLLAVTLLGRVGLCADGALNTPPEGFVALFNGKDLSGWKGLVADPPKRAAMSPAELAAAQKVADERMRAHWSVVDGVLVFDGKGDSLCTAKDYGDFELWVDWLIEAQGDSGLYLRGSPQVQIWDPAQRPEGSGGLFNNQRHPSKPLVRADRPIGEWNTFRIFMVGELVTVYLNGTLVVDRVPLENYWERSKPIYPTGQIELQNHGNTLRFRNIYLREIPRLEGRYATSDLLLEKGDRVAVVGDSITEQKLYSRFIETYLLACVPQLELRVMQLGWSGERAPGFANRMENDLLPFRPNLVTTCYGMNDGLYRPYEPGIGQTYRDAMAAIVERLVREGATVVSGSPGAVDFHSFRRQNLPPEVYNDNLAHLRDIAREVAHANGQPFANVHDAMILAMQSAKPVLGDDYHVCGRDGFHPSANGHLVMAYAFLRSMGLDGEIGRVDVDASTGAATASDGHRVVEAGDGRVVIESSRYPFCFPGDERSPESTRSILPHVPFQSELNRLTLVVRGLDSDRVRVRWGGAAKEFSKAELERGVNLAAEFLDNPFLEAFQRVDQLVAAKQAYETPMVKSIITRFREIERFVGDDPEATGALETLRRRLMAKDDALHESVLEAIRPVRHEIGIEKL